MLTLNCLVTEIPPAPHILEGNYISIVPNKTSTAAEALFLATLKLRMPIDAASFDLKHFTVRQCTSISSHNPSYSSINVTLIDDSTEIVVFPMKGLSVSSKEKLCVTVSAVSKCLQEGVPSLSRNISELKLRGKVWNKLNHYFLLHASVSPVYSCGVSQCG